jgi:hypothetical protein
MTITKEYLKLALVSCPIALYAACSTAERIAFRQINKATGNRLRQQLIDEETCATPRIISPTCRSWRWSALQLDPVRRARCRSRVPKLDPLR